MGGFIEVLEVLAKLGDCVKVVVDLPDFYPRKIVGDLESLKRCLKRLKLDRYTITDIIQMKNVPLTAEEDDPESYQHNNK